MRTPIASLLIALLPAAAGAQVYREDFSWQFPEGNLVSNWSFENLTDEVCGDIQPGTGGTLTNCRKFSYVPKSGNHVLTVELQNQGAVGDVSVSQTSRPLPVEANADYVFSTYFVGYWYERIASSHAEVCWLREDKTSLGCYGNAPTYISLFPNGTTEWAAYNFEFRTPPEARYITFNLVESDNDGSAGFGDYLEFDNLMIRKKSLTSGVLESRAYSNAEGKVEQTIQYDGEKQVIQQKAYDDQGRLVTEYLPAVNHSRSIKEVIVSALDLWSEMNIDYPDIQEAVVSLAGKVSRKVAADLPESVILHVIVPAGGGNAPVSAQSMTIQPLTSSDGKKIPLLLKGVLRGSAEYQALLLTHGFDGYTEPTPGHFDGNLSSLLAVQYPGQSNLYSEFRYPNPGVTTVSSSSLPGSLYGPGTRLNRSGMALLTSDNLPSNPEYSSNPGDVEARYTYTWSRDPQGVYTASIIDERGLKTLSAVSKTTAPVSASDWLVTRYAYDEFGRPLRTTTPDGLSTTTNYDASGQAAYQNDPDRGYKMVVTDRFGRPRFSRTNEAITGGYFLATQYDNQGRPLGVGRVTTPADFTVARAEQDNYPGVANLERGTVYDYLDTYAFAEATGVPPTYLGYFPTLTNTQGKPAFMYNRNPQAAGPSATAPELRLVATFLSYDQKGRLADAWKYIGPAKGGKRWHRFQYAYDDKDRLASTTAYADQTTGQVVTRSTYVYDQLGNVKTVLDKNGGVLAEYTLDELERMASVQLSGGMKMQYAYDVQGKVSSIEALQNPGPGQKSLFKEYLGYEEIPHGQIQNPGVIEQRFDGKVSSLVRKFSSAAPNPVEWWVYDYDDPGRMIGSSKYRPSSGGGLGSDGSLNFPVTFSSQPSAYRGYSYTGDGSISMQTDGGTVSNYAYTSGTHKLANITPSLPGRTISGFQWDADGRMKNDNGSGKNFTYGYDDMPVKASVSGKTLHFYYDENGYRVATLEETSPGLVLARKVFVYESGLNVAKEFTHRESSHPAGAVDVGSFREYGQGGVAAISYSSGTDRHVLIKDHQGSVVGAVSAQSGAFVNEQGYMPYGSKESRVTTGSDLVPSEAYTGKGMEALLGLYNFGARLYDPEVGIWLTPDAVNVYFNPYIFGGGTSGGDPVNYTDPDGNCPVCVILVAAAIGAAIAGAGDIAVQAYQRGDDWYKFNRNDWGQTGTAAFVGGVAGAAGGAGALAIGGLAASATGAVGLATNSGLAAAMAGGAVTGLGAGAAAGFAGYSAGVFAGNDYNDFDGWDPGDAAEATIYGAGTGALTGAAAGGLGYGLSNNVRNATHQTVIEYGARNGRYQDAINYAAKSYKINGKFTFDPQLGPRGITELNGKVRIGPNAFSETDGSRLVSVLDHESAHVAQISKVGGIMPKEYAGLKLPPNPGQGYIIHTREAGAYYYNIQQSAAHGYSSSVNNYTMYKYQQSVDYLWNGY